MARVMLDRGDMKTRGKRKRRRILPALALAEVPLGTFAGAAAGAFAGPVGLVAGAIIGSVVGAALAIADNVQMHRDMEPVDRYDEDVGITKGSLGSANLLHPPATVGAYSAGSTGVGAGDEGIVAEGPFNPLG